MSVTSQVIDYKRLASSQDEMARRYQSAEPFPHIVIDNFFRPELVAYLSENFPDMSVKKKAGSVHIPVILKHGEEAQLGKQWMSRERFVPLDFRRIYWELNSYPFVAFLEKITGIENLIADPHLAGGGVHETSVGGYLKVHADFNKHPQLGLDRRLNILIYLNEDWQPEYGGNLELWSTDMKQCVQSVEPVAGRCVIFSTTSTSFHGHPRPLTCPPDRSRRSIALYYYTNGRPEEEGLEEHETLWQETPQLTGD